jgi:hypothetical protein
MSDKFDMKLVIDAVTTPLLHARLCAASSPRQRAALLRTLAEAALRGTPVQPMERPAYASLQAPEVPATVALPSRHGVELDAPSVIDTSNEGAVEHAHDASRLADEFAAYL